MEDFGIDIPPDQLSALAHHGEAKADEFADAIARYGIDPESANPWTD